DLPYVTSIVHLEADLSQSAIVPEPSEADQLQELPFAPVQAPVITLGPHISSSSVTMSRRSLAQFHTSGFPDILDCHNEIAEVTHPSDPVSFDPLQEEGDFLLSNEIVLQFLAFTRRTPDTTAPEDNNKRVKRFFMETKVPMKKLVSVTTDRAPTMTGRHAGFIAQCKSNRL
ncbi:NPHP4 protein, partial [Polypterus senegalus]